MLKGDLYPARTPKTPGAKKMLVRLPASVSPSLAPRESRNRATEDKDASSHQGVLHPHTHSVVATASGTPILPHRPPGHFTDPQVHACHVPS